MLLKNLILITSFNFLISCEGVGKKENKVEEKNRKEMSVIVKQGFIPPDENLFKRRIKEIFGVDIYAYQENQQKYSGSLPEKSDHNIKTLIPRFGYISESENQPQVHLREKYIAWSDPEEDSISEMYLNKYLFYKDKASFNFLKANKSGYLYYLLLDFGYEEDEELVNFIFNEIVNKDSSNENEEFSNRVFIGSTGIFGKYQLREKLIKKFYTLFPNSDFMYDNLAEVILNKKKDIGYEYEGNRYEDAALLLEYQLKYAKNELGTLIYGGVDSILEKNPLFLEELKKNNSYNNPLLRDYVVDFKIHKNKQYSYIQDSDGYTNLRKEKKSTSEILQQIKSGDQIEVLDNSSDWFLVETKEGKKGYVHKSRIKN